MKKTIAMSPVPQTNEKKTMDFPNAIREVINGKKIHKLEWKNKEFYGFREGGILMLHKPDGKSYQWIISDGDMMGEDFVSL